VSDELPDRLLSADGKAGWFAFAPDGSRPDDREERPWRPPPHRSVIRLMGEHTVSVPLWSDEDGLMFSEPEELIEEFGVSSDLAADLEAWGIAWEKQAGQPEHDAEAARLVRRLDEELDNHYLFVYWP
jgi:hypothetical protein